MSAGIHLKDFISSSLSRDSTPWGREVEERIKSLEKATIRGDANGLNANKAQNSSIDLVSSTLVDLQAGVNAAIANASVPAANIVGPSFIAQARINSVATSALSGDIANNVVNTLVTTTDLYALSVNTNITATRVTLWGRVSDGYIGTATSSRRAKANIEPADIDPLAVLSLEVKHYQWIEQLRMRDDPTFPGYVGPHHHVPVEVGLIAEEMHARGLWQFVIYEQEVDPEFPAIYSDEIWGPPELNQDGEVIAPSALVKPAELVQAATMRTRIVDGQPIPQSIHYSLLYLMGIVVEQYLHELIGQLFDGYQRLNERMRKVELALFGAIDPTDDPDN